MSDGSLDERPHSRSYDVVMRMIAAPGLSLVLLAACASGPVITTVAPKKPAMLPPKSADSLDQTFPSAETLTQIATQPVPGFSAELRTYTESFTVPAPMPSSWVDAATLDTDSQMLTEALATIGKPNHRATRAGRCVARALAKFVGLHGLRPDADVKAYVQGRCRAVWSASSAGWLSAPRKRGDSTAAWLRRVAPKLRAMIERVAERGGQIDYGMATANVRGRTVSLLVYGKRGVEMKRVERKADGAAFVLEGRVVGAASEFMAFVNRGPTDVARCQRDTAVDLPAFRVTCPTAAEDAQAWIELAAVGLDGVEGLRLGRLLVSPSGAKRWRYRVPSLQRTAQPLVSTEDWGTYLALAINRIRAQENLSPLVVDAAQTAVAASLVPYYFGRRSVDLSDRQRTILLGLRAGWDVEGGVRFGEVVAATSSRFEDPSHLLGTLFARPYVRSVLMDPEARRMALAPLWLPERQFAAVLISTYAVVDDVDLSTVEARVAKSLADARASLGRGPPTPWGLQADARARVGAALVDNRLTGSDARRWLEEQYGPSSRWQVQGIALTAYRLDEIPWPRALLEAGQPVLDIVAAYRRPEGHAWARYEILVMRRGR